MNKILCSFLLLHILLALNTKAQTTAPDASLLAEINQIKAIDNHAHPLPFLKEGEKDDDRNDPKLKKTNFVLIHGGLPFAQGTKFLLDKENVYADFSSQGFLTSTRELSGVIRSWLEFVPEKVLFGTDAYPLTTSLRFNKMEICRAFSNELILILAQSLKISSHKNLR